MPPDDSALLHGQPYDPAKAHEYYLRTRKLKGRLAGGEDPSKGTSGGRAQPLRRPTAAKTNAYVSPQVVMLRARLEELQAKLAKMINDAKGSSSKTSKTGSSKTGGSSSDKKDKPLSAAEKRKAAQRSKEWRDKHKEPSSKDNTQTITELRAQISEIRAKLKVALENSRRNSSNPQTASKGR